MAWDDVESPHAGDYLERIEVPGGWLYRCWIIDKEHDVLALAMTFVPNPQWGLKSD